MSVRIGMPKEKVTFTIDAKVIEKARELGVNLSWIAESALKSYAFSSRGASKKTVYEGYQALFEIMQPLLDAYETEVVIGHDEFGPPDDPTPPDRYVLNPSGRIERVGEWGSVSTVAALTSIPIRNLLAPMDILKNLLESLETAKARQEQTAADLDLAKRMLFAIQTSLLKSRSESAADKAENESRESP